MAGSRVNRNPFQFMVAVFAALMVVIALVAGFCTAGPGADMAHADDATTAEMSVEPLDWATDLISSLPAFDETTPYVELDGGIPSFTEEERSRVYGFEMYGDLDDLGRATQSFVGVGHETLAWGERPDISGIHPSGWQGDVYDFVDGGNLFNRCHLVAFVLSGEGANERNLVTGTRWLNTQGMQPFETSVATYVDQTGNHVLYRVTPVFVGDELVCRGVVMEGWSVEDAGAGVCFKAFAYNCQPGVGIDYATGANWALENGDASGWNADATGVLPGAATASLAQGIVASTGEGEDASGGDGSSDNVESADESTDDAPSQEYVLNTNTHKFHYPWCSSVDDMKEKNKRFTTETRDEIIAQGYAPCKRCNP